MNCSIPLAAGVFLVLLCESEAIVTGVPLLAAADAHHSPSDVHGGNSPALYGGTSDDTVAVSAVQTKLTKITKVTPLWAVAGQASKAPEAGYAAARNATIAQVAPARAARPAATEPPDGVVDIVVASKERPAAGGAKRQEAPSSRRHEHGPGLVSLDSALKQKEQEGSRGGGSLVWIVGGGILFVVLPAMFFFGCLSLSSQINSPGLVAGAVANVLGRFRRGGRREQPHRTDRAEEAPESPRPPASALYSRRATPPPPPVHTAGLMASQVYGSKHVHFHVAPSFASAPSSSSSSEHGLRSTPDAPTSPPSPCVLPPFMGPNFKAADGKLPGPECYYIGDSRPMLGSYRPK